MNYLLLLTALNIQIVYPDQATCKDAVDAIVEYRLSLYEQDTQFAKNVAFVSEYKMRQKSYCIPLGKDYLGDPSTQHLVQPLVTRGAMVHE